MPAQHFAIAGSGTAGLTAAITLARLGHRVTLFERSPEARALGAGILLQPSGISVLTPLFQSDKPFGAVRDNAFLLANAIPFSRRQALRTVAGIKTGLLFERDLRLSSLPLSSLVTSEEGPEPHKCDAVLPGSL